MTAPIQGLSFRGISLENVAKDQDTSRMLEIVEACSQCRCGCCKDQCPMYSDILEESMSPKGRNALIRAVMKGEVEPDERTVRIAYSCLLCRRDETSCTAGLRNAEAAEIFRRHLVDKGAKLLPEHAVLIKSLENYRNPWQEPKSARKRWARGLQEKKVAHGSTDILFFVGCTYALDHTLQESPKALASLMDKAHVNYSLLTEDEVCCGSIAKRIGDSKVFESIKKENEQRIRSAGVQTIVTACAGCYKTLRQDYQELSEDVSIMHSTQFIADLASTERLEFSRAGIKVTYHDPCHLGRHSEIYEAPRTALELVPGLQLVEMKNSKQLARCCGGGAGVKTAYPEIAQRVALSRVQEAEETGAEVLVTACPFCVQTLRTAAFESHSKMVVEEFTVLMDRLALGRKGGKV